MPTPNRISIEDDFAGYLEQILIDRFIAKPVKLIKRPVWIEFLLWSLAGLILMVGVHLLITP